MERVARVEARLTTAKHAPCHTCRRENRLRLRSAEASP
jgi:hypothetical protein